MSKILTFSIKQQHSAISKMVRHNFVSFPKPEISSKTLKVQYLIFNAFCIFHENTLKQLQKFRNGRKLF